MGNSSAEITSKPKKKRDVVGAIILISLGIIFLLHNFSLLPPNFWNTIWLFWPVIFILLGLQQMSGNSIIGEWLVAIVSILIVYTIFALTLNLPLPKEMKHIRLNLPLEQRLKPSQRSQDLTPFYADW
jgi:multisubunit Na+/H+ antiporter MnhB subunit